MIRRVVLIAGGLLVLAVAPANAAFPGQNGKIAFVCGANSDICTMNPDGTGQVNLTNSTATDQNPTWSPDGTRIAFDSGPFGAELIYVMNADGTGLVQVGSPPHYARYPSWSADGTRISAIWCCPEDDDEIATFDATTGGDVQRPYGSVFGLFAQEWSPDGARFAGSEPRPFTTGGVELFVTGFGFATQNGDFNEDPTWSPDAAWVAFFSGVSPPGLYKIRPNGSDMQHVASVGRASWSPDGQKFVVSGIRTMNADGTGLSAVLAPGSQPDWQPIPVNSYPRPKGATPFRASLAIAYEPCTAPDRTHGPPLAFPSCAGPQQASDYLTVGTADANAQPALNEGHLRLDTQAGAPGGPDDADVAIEFFMDDVFRKPPPTDYAGELRARVSMQITDKDNTPHSGGPGAATTTQIPLELIVSCTPVAAANEGSVCPANTSADALAPGTVKEGRRSLWQLGAVEVYDGGPDGDAQTPAGDTLVATQGIFVP